MALVHLKTNYEKPIFEANIAASIYEILVKNFVPGMQNSQTIDPQEYVYLYRSIEKLVFKNLPILMILPAFPAKSPNREKTLSSNPDMGEYIAFKKLKAVCDKIDAVYSQGSKITICSDGHVFSDIVQVTDDEVSNYGEALEQMAKRLLIKQMRFFRLSDVFTGMSWDQARGEMLARFARSVEDVRNDVIADDAEKFLFNGIHRFMFEDLLYLNPGISRNAAREKAKNLAYQVILRSHAWSQLVEGVFKNSVRLSIHPQAYGSKKFGVNLVPSTEIWRTPWHGSPVLDQGVFKILPKKQATELGALQDWSEDGYEFLRI